MYLHVCNMYEHICVHGSNSGCFNLGTLARHWMERGHPFITNVWLRPYVFREGLHMCYAMATTLEDYFLQMTLWALTTQAKPYNLTEAY